MTTEELHGHLVQFVMAFSIGAVLMDELPRQQRVKRMQALAVATSEQIKERLETADDSECEAMLVVSRKHLRQARTFMLGYPIPTQAAKARTEWMSVCKRLEKETNGVGA